MGIMPAMNATVAVCLATAATTLTIGTAPLVSQTATATGQATLQLAVERVSLDLAVRDKHNKPILDLKPDEVTVADNGKQAKLTDLRLVSGEHQNEPLITLLFDRPGMEDSSRRSEDSLFGTSATSARDNAKKLHRVAARFLSAFPSGGFRFAVVDVWGRLQIQQEYSTNRKATEEAVSAAVQPEVYGTKVEANEVERRLARVAKTGQDLTGAAVNVQERTLARTIYTAQRSSSRIAIDQHLSPSQASLLALVEAQQSLPGRKVIVYFNSVGARSDDPYYRPDTDSHAKDALKSIVGAANQAGVSIYVVVPEELQERDENFAMSTADAVGGTQHLSALSTVTRDSSAEVNLNYDLQAAVAPTSEGILSAQEDLSMLAKQTGGNVLIGFGRMAGPVKDIVRNLGSYYEASFVPPSGVEDGTFHTTTFNTSRKGLRMRARTGYLAMPPTAGISDPLQPFEVPLMALLKRQQLPEDVDYRARVIQMEHADEGNIGLVALEVPISALQVRSDTSTRLSSAHISVLATITDSAGTEIERFSEDNTRRWSTENGAGAAPAYISFERSFAAPAGTYVLETAIMDSNSGRTAAKRQTFEISDSQPVPDLSDLMVVRGIELPNNLSSEQDLLWRGDRRVLPNLYGELPANEHKVSVFFLAHMDEKSQAPATAKLEVLRDGKPLKGEPLISKLKGGEEFSPVLTAFSISSAASGKYQVRVTLTQGGKSAEKTAELELTGEGRETSIASTSPTSDAPIAVDPPELVAAEQSLERPSKEDLDRILADARKSALEYEDSLPNLICLQTTERYDAHGNADWQLKDTIIEVLNYVNHKESRTLVGAKTTGEKEETTVNSSGEFGAALTNIFKPESKAKFTWKETGALRGEPAEVFDYSVEKENSPFVLNALSVASANVGYHGRIYIDQATHWVKSLTIITDEQPKKFPIHKVAIRVDYDYVAINDHDYFLPVSAQLITKVSGAIGDVLRRNDLAFSNFRRFGSSVRIFGVTAEEKPQ